jgi:hypothetical protein
MNDYKRAVISIIVIVIFMVVLEVYLFIKKEHLIAVLLLIFILSLWFIFLFILNKQIASLYFEKEIMNYLKMSNGQVTMEKLFEHLDNLAGKQNKTDTLEIMNYSIEKLQNKKKVIREEHRLIKCT